VIGDAGENEAQIRFRIDAVEICGTNEAIDCGGTFVGRVCSGEQIVMSNDGHGAQCVLGDQVVNLGLTVAAGADNLALFPIYGHWRGIRATDHTSRKE
jgi:hypothetical protein